MNLRLIPPKLALPLLRLSVLPGYPSNPLSSYTQRPHIHIASIDNSLSFLHEHPHGWRSYTYGWLYLPVSLIGKPFSERTRQRFLHPLTSKAWREETTYQLRKHFALGPGFHPKMFYWVSKQVYRSISSQPTYAPSFNGLAR